MKRLVLMAVVMVLLLPALAMAAGSVTVTREQLSDDGKVLVIKLSCVGDASDGSVPDTDIDHADIGKGLAKNYWQMGFYIFDVWTEAGTEAPDAADVTVTDSYGRVVYDEDNVVGASGTTEGTVTVKAILGQLTVAVDNQATASAEYDIYIQLAR